MIHTHDHSRCIESALRDADALCLSRGVRFTPIRRRVLRLIWSEHAAVKAYDLLDHLKDTDPAAKPATVYRALDFLLEQGFIHRIESLNAFIGCSAMGAPHELLLMICDQCHHVQEYPAPDVMTAVAEEVRAARFRPRSQTFEIHGLCAVCGDATSHT